MMHNRPSASCMFYLAKISFILFLVAGLYFFYHPDIIDLPTSLLTIFYGKRGCFLHCTSSHASVLFLSKMEHSPDKPTRNDRVG